MTQHNTIQNEREVWGIRTHAGLKERLAEIGGVDPIIQGLIPSRSIGLLVGDSGIGKSPLLYQAALCITEGIPFLGLPVKKGSVIYFDYENGLGQVADLITSLVKHLGIPACPTDLGLWNRNDVPADWEGKQRTILKAAKNDRPQLIIIDSLSAFDPDAEESNRNASNMIQEVRDLTAEGITVLATHHLRKASNNPNFQPIALKEGNAAEFLKQARGAGALINSIDFRLAADIPRVATSSDELVHGNSEEPALVLGGFERVTGAMPLIHLARVVGDNGEPLGYKRLGGTSLLSAQQRAAFGKLGNQFRFKDAKLAYGKAAQPTTDFLRKCDSLGLLRRIKVGYEKIDQHLTVPDCSLLIQ